MDELNIREIDRLIEWLKAHGHSAEEAAECIEFIASCEEK